MDPAHLLIEGEDFATAIAMVLPWLSLIAVKDVALTRVEKNGHGSMKREWVVAGEGGVDWTDVFEVLNKVGYDGPVSIHCEFKVPDEEFVGAVQREIAFFNRFIG
jgi:sugar phosphate isomerase/epimerase